MMEPSSSSSLSERMTPTSNNNDNKSHLDNNVENTTVGNKDKGIGFKIPSWWSWWFVIDWILIFGVVIFCTVFFEDAPGVIPPFERFQVNATVNPEVLYPYRSSIIPTWMLVVTSTLLPISVFLLSQIFMKSIHDFHHAMLGCGRTLSSNFFITGILKLSAGGLRPNYVARTLGAASVRDGMQSFPSGHASHSFAAMLFVSLYISGKLGIFRKYQNSPPFVLVLLVFSPMVIAFATAVSRVMDYNHHFVDIVAGSVLGIVLAYICYPLSFYPISSDISHLPKESNPTILEKKKKDEEQNLVQKEQQPLRETTNIEP